MTMETTPLAASSTDVSSPTRRALRRAVRHGSFMMGGCALIVIVLAALLAPVLGLHDPYTQDLSRRLIPPIWHDTGTWEHMLGTDALGRDYLSRLVFGSRISLLIGLATVAISSVIGTTLGLLAGYYGGKVDLAVNFLVTTRLTLPIVLVALVVVAIMGNSLSILIGVIGLLLWDRFAVVVRSTTRQVVSLDYVAAARVSGCSHLRIIFRTILPNIMGSLIVVATVEMTHAILLESALSFLGLGVQPPLPSWGLMVAEARSHFFFNPWLVAVPGTAIFVLIFSINMLGDGVRDVTSHTDP